jgi:hypothetical protein
MIHFAAPNLQRGTHPLTPGKPSEATWAPRASQRNEHMAVEQEKVRPSRTTRESSNIQAGRTIPKKEQLNKQAHIILPSNSITREHNLCLANIETGCQKFTNSSIRHSHDEINWEENMHFRVEVWSNCDVNTTSAMPVPMFQLYPPHFGRISLDIVHW